MTIAPYTETAFEQVIESHLLANGYQAVSSKGYDSDRALFPDIALQFIQVTQPKEWQRLEKLHGENTGSQIITDLSKWLDMHGCLKVLRHGFKCYSRPLKIAYFKAAHGLNTELETRYQANHLGITRQLKYRQGQGKKGTRSQSSKSKSKSAQSKSKSSQTGTYNVGKSTKDGIIDITLSLNGIPIATIELKNPLTGQTAEDAKTQYRRDRDGRDRIFEFKRRTLVHFAADTEVVWMTTRLASSATYFLPFNQGCDNRAGNPLDSQGRNYRTAYLWEDVLQRDSLLDLLARFLHLQTDEKYDNDGRKFKKETLIFPRYHQLQAVRSIEQAAKREGVGHNYLIEHSAGSGKSNTIGWLTHRLVPLGVSKPPPSVPPCKGGKLRSSPFARGS